MFTFESGTLGWHISALTFDLQEEGQILSPGTYGGPRLTALFQILICKLNSPIDIGQILAKYLDIDSKYWQLELHQRCFVK